MPPTDTAIDTRLNELITDARTTQLIYVAAKLKLADRLAHGPQPYQALAAAAGAHPGSLYRLLRALASLGVFAEIGPGQFGLTPLAEGLRADQPGSLHTLALSYGPWWWLPMGHLLQSVLTGETAFNYVSGMDLFEYLSRNPEESAVHDKRMAAMTAGLTAAILAAYDFSNTRTLVEVAGGQGGLAAAILRTYPQARAILFDLPSVTAGARRQLDALGLADRCETVAGDFFTSVPSQGDTYILKEILHDWDDARAANILRNCRQAMGAAKLLVIERLIPPGNGAMAGKMIDISMLVMTGGQERTEAEYAALFTASGLKLQQIFPTKAELSVMEAVPT